MDERFKVELEKEGEGRLIRIARSGGKACSYRIAKADQQDYMDFFAAVARDFGTRLPRNRSDHPAPPADPRFRPLLTENIAPGILYGYGDPAVRWVEEERAWYMTVTSNDAPDAFPILRSRDLEHWECAGFAFPKGRTPSWASVGRDVADYWAAELARCDEHWLLCFTAREHDDRLAIGVARGPSPAGPFAPPEAPLLQGDVIDSHIFRDADGTLILYWKDDANRHWPPALARLLHHRPELIESMFEGEPDRRTAALSAALWPCLRHPAHMERFFALQPLIEATVANFAQVRDCLKAHGGEEAEAALRAMRTAIYAQRLSLDGGALEGERRVVLENDLDWEGHLIEGPWLTLHQGRYWLFYAGNDFSTPEYGVGVAVADDPYGPFVKQGQPLLQSSKAWEGPGHPSVAPGVDGEPAIFFHAFFPGRAGYNEFRALLMAKLRFDDGKVAIV